MNSPLNNIKQELPETPSFKTPPSSLNYQLNDIPVISINDVFQNKGFNNQNYNYQYNNQNYIPNYNNITHNGQTRLVDVDMKISKYSDFLSISYFMFIWSILCLLISIFNLTYNSKDNEYLNNNFQNYRWYYILGFFVNFFHCGTYYYCIRSYNKQSKSEMDISSKMSLTLIMLNLIYFLIYIFFVSISFFTFCVDLIFLIFNALLFFQSKELGKLYQEKDNIKLIYL